MSIRAILLALCLITPAYALPSQGDPAPKLVITELNGTTFDLAQQRGHVAIINFWATWCPPCRAEMPALDAFYTRYQGRGVTLLGISTDHRRDRDLIDRAMQGIHYPAAILANADTNGFGKPSAMPVTIIIGPDGVVRDVLMPDTTPMTEQKLDSLVQPLLPRPAG